MQGALGQNNRVTLWCPQLPPPTLAHARDKALRDPQQERDVDQCRQAPTLCDTVSQGDWVLEGTAGPELSAQDGKTPAITRAAVTGWFLGYQDE